jgi:hypothetical protein
MFRLAASQPLPCLCLILALIHFASPCSLTCRNSPSRRESHPGGSTHLRRVSFN